MENTLDNSLPPTVLRKKNMPLVSVLMPCYNTVPEHLHAAIQSILDQTFTDFEFLILNDSPDNLAIKEIVQSYNDPRIIYLSNEVNLGISQSRNKLLKLAKGSYLAVFDHDDISLPTRLEKEVAYLNENPHIGVVSSNMQFFPQYRVTKHPEDNYAIKCAMIHYLPIAHTAMMVRKSILIDNNIEYEENYSPAEDYMLIVRLMNYTMFHNLPEVLVHYRWHESNATVRLKERMDDASQRVRGVIVKLYPEFVRTANEKHKVWISLFFFIPFIKIIISKKKVKYYLFGFIPLLKIKGS